MGGSGGNVKIVGPTNIINNATERRGPISLEFIGGFPTVIDLRQGFQGTSGKGGEPGTGGRDFQDNNMGGFGPCSGVNSQYMDSKTNRPSRTGSQPVNSHERDGKMGQISLLQESFYYQYAPLEFAQLLMLKAESLYLNYDSSIGSELNGILNYIIRLSNNNPGFSYLDSKNNIEIESFLFYSKRTQIDKNAWNNLQTKAKSYLIQLGIGQDIFGNGNRFAPNLNADYLLKKYKEIVPLVDGFEDFVNKILTSQENLKVDQEKANLCIQQLSSNLVYWQTELKKLIDDVIRLDKVVLDRWSQIEARKSDLDLDDSKLKEAVKAASGGCELPAVITFAVAIISGVSAIGGIATAAVTAFQGLNELVSGLEGIDSIDYIKTALSSEGIITAGVKDLSKIGDIGGNLDKVKNAYGQIKNINKPESVINIDRNNFDEQIEKYLNYPEAEKFKSDFHDYLDFIEKTNNIRIELTTAYTSMITTLNNIEFAKKQIDDLKSQSFVDSGRMMNASIKQSIYNLYLQTKMAICKLIYLQNKAIQYQDPCIEHNNLAFTDLSIASLHANLFNQNLMTLDRLNNIRYQSSANQFPLSIRPVEHPLVFKKFSKGQIDPLLKKNIYTIEFNIKVPDLSISSKQTDIDAIVALRQIFGDIRNIKVTGVLGDFITKSNHKKKIKFYIEHQGSSLVTTDSNFQKPKQFEHNPVRSTQLVTILPVELNELQFKNKDQNNLVGYTFGGSSLSFAGVSPFASWKIFVYEVENPGLSKSEIEGILADIKSIDLYFYFLYQGV